jgi:hypothetical protein
MKLYEEFKLYENLWESPSKVITKETDQLYSVVFDDVQQIFTGSREECENYLKRANGPASSRLSIKDTAQICIRESIPQVANKQSDEIWTLAFKDDPNYPIVQGDKDKIDAFYSNLKDQPASKAHGGLVIKQGGNVSVAESVVDDPYGYGPYKTFADPTLTVGDYVLAPRPFSTNKHTTYPAKITSISDKWIDYEISGFGFMDKGTKARPGSIASTAINTAKKYLNI